MIKKRIAIVFSSQKILFYSLERSLVVVNLWKLGEMLILPNPFWLTWLSFGWVDEFGDVDVIEICIFIASSDYNQLEDNGKVRNKCYLGIYIIKQNPGYPIHISEALYWIIILLLNALSNSYF